jgi:hypothetical protein
MLPSPSFLRALVRRRPRAEGAARANSFLHSDHAAGGPRSPMAWGASVTTPRRRPASRSADAVSAWVRPRHQSPLQPRIACPAQRRRDFMAGEVRAVYA